MGGILCENRWKRVSLWSLPVLQHTCTGCLGKPHLQMEGGSHRRVLSLAHAQSEWLLLSFVSWSCSTAVCTLLSPRSWRNTLEDRPHLHLFWRYGRWTVLGDKRGFGHPAMCTLGLPWGPTLMLSREEWVLPQPNPYMLVTLWPYNMKALKEKSIYQFSGLTVCP